MSDEAPKEWLLVKRGLYYRPDNCGYTGIKDHAGRYSLAEMNESVRAGNGVSGIHEAGAPEFTTACFDDLARDHLTKQRDELRDGIRALQKVWFSGIDLDKDAISQACLTLFRVLNQQNAAGPLTTKHPRAPVS